MRIAILLLLFAATVFGADGTSAETRDAYLPVIDEKYAEGDYNASRDLCEYALKRAPGDADFEEKLAASKRQLERMAEEAYTNGLVLEDLRLIEGAKQYWLRASNYVRPGDRRYGDVKARLAHYGWWLKDYDHTGSR